MTIFNSYVGLPEGILGNNPPRLSPHGLSRHMSASRILRAVVIFRPPFRCGAVRGLVAQDQKLPGRGDGVDPMGFVEQKHGELINGYSLTTIKHGS